MGGDLRLVRYGTISGAGKAITAVTQAAAASSSFGSSLRFQRCWEQACRYSRCGFDRSDDIAGVILKEIEQRTRSRSARVRQAEPACDAGLERPGEKVFGPTCEQV